MQFMSQSMGWADNIVLAMAPLGIITAVISAVRVGGPAWLKAIIGRIRENRAMAEVDLMSSTSKEVCELWNGQEVVRVLGQGPIREFIILANVQESQTTSLATPDVGVYPLDRVQDKYFDGDGQWLPSLPSIRSIRPPPPWYRSHFTVCIANSPLSASSSGGRTG